MANQKPKVEPWHLSGWNLANISAEEITDAFRMLLHEERYTKLFNTRVAAHNSIVKMDNSGGRYVPSQMVFAFKQLLQADERIALYVLSYLANYERSHVDRSVNDLKGFQEEYKDDAEAQAIFAQIGNKMKFLIAITNMAETLVLDIQTLVRKVSEDNNFTGAEGLMAGLRQIRSVLGEEQHNKSQEVKDLWIELYDSMEAYAMKRIESTFKKEEKMQDRAIKAKEKAKAKLDKEALAKAKAKLDKEALAKAKAKREGKRSLQNQKKTGK